MNSTLRRTARGFTLVEVLVVVGIIMLLAAILFPVLLRARENARRTSCMNNLRQIALGIQQYVQDHDRRYPPAPPPPGEFPPGVEPGELGWAWSVREKNYVNSDAVFQCPSELDRTKFTDYWMNFGLLELHDVKINNPANIILMGDGDNDHKGIGGFVDYAIGPDAEENWETDSNYATRHLGGSNFSFADGHVKWLNPGQVSTTEEPTGSNFTFVTG